MSPERRDDLVVEIVFPAVVMGAYVLGLVIGRVGRD